MHENDAEGTSRNLSLRVKRRSGEPATFLNTCVQDPCLASSLLYSEFAFGKVKATMKGPPPTTTPRRTPGRTDKRKASSSARSPEPERNKSPTTAQRQNAKAKG